MLPLGTVEHQPQSCELSVFRIVHIDVCLTVYKWSDTSFNPTRVVADAAVTGGCGGFGDAGDPERWGSGGGPRRCVWRGSRLKCVFYYVR
jgi:hypothetical protein